MALPPDVLRAHIETCKVAIADLERRIAEYTWRAEDARMMLDGLQKSLDVQRRLLAADMDTLLGEQMAADVLDKNVADRMQQCYESAGGKDYKPDGASAAFHCRHPQQEQRELTAHLPLIGDAEKPVAHTACPECRVEPGKVASTITCDDVVEAVAGGWCHPTNGHKEMDGELAYAIIGNLCRKLGIQNTCPPVSRRARSDEDANEGDLELLRHCEQHGTHLGWYGGNRYFRYGSMVVGFTPRHRSFAPNPVPPELMRDAEDVSGPSDNGGRRAEPVQVASDAEFRFGLDTTEIALVMHGNVYPLKHIEFPDGISGDFHGSILKEQSPVCATEDGDNCEFDDGFSEKPPGNLVFDDIHIVKSSGPGITSSPEEVDVPLNSGAPAKKTDSRGVRYEGDRMVSATGAVRSSDAQHERYDLIGVVGERRLAETYAEGAVKYTDDNWLFGFPISDVLNHVRRHINLWRRGDNSEDHLAHAAWGLFAIMEYEENNHACIDIKTRRNPDGTVKQYPRWWTIKENAA